MISLGLGRGREGEDRERYRKRRILRVCVCVCVCVRARANGWVRKEHAHQENKVIYNTLEIKATNTTVVCISQFFLQVFSVNNKPMGEYK